MRSILSALSCCTLNLRKWPANPRIYVLALLLIGYLNLEIRPVADFAGSVGVPATPWIFPYITIDRLTLMLVMLGVVLLFCDAPFIDEHQPYVLIRAGKRDWLWGQVLYIMLGSLCYFLFVAVVSALLLLPHLTFAGGWGKIWGTLAQTDAGSHLQLAVSYSLQANYTPLAAMAWSLLLSWLAGVFLGLLLFVLNMRLARELGAVVGAALALLTYFCRDANGFLLYYFSPLSWASLGNLDVAQTSLLPSTTYAVCALVALNIILIVLADLLLRRKDIDIMPPL